MVQWNTPSVIHAVAGGTSHCHRRHAVRPYITASAGDVDLGGAWSYTCSAPGAAGRLLILQVFQDGTSANNANKPQRHHLENDMATAKKTTKPPKKTAPPEPVYSMPQEVKDWIERAQSIMNHQKGEIERLKDENAKLKRMLADAMLDNVALKDLLGKKW